MLVTSQLVFTVIIGPVRHYGMLSAIDFLLKKIDNLKIYDDQNFTITIEIKRKILIPSVMHRISIFNDFSYLDATHQMLLPIPLKSMNGSTQFTIPSYNSTYKSRAMKWEKNFVVRYFVPFVVVIIVDYAQQQLQQQVSNYWSISTDLMRSLYPHSLECCYHCNC